MHLAAKSVLSFRLTGTFFVQGPFPVTEQIEVRDYSLLPDDRPSIERALVEIRPGLQADGWSIEFNSIDGHAVHVLTAE